MTASPRLSLTVEGMSCNHCVGAVKRALASVPDIAEATVTIGAAQLTLRGGTVEQVASDAIGAIGKAGYRAAVAPTT